MDKLMELFEFESIAAIKKIRFSTTQREDKLIWIKDEKGRFSSKAAYSRTKNNWEQWCAMTKIMETEGLWKDEIIFMETRIQHTANKGEFG